MEATQIKSMKNIFFVLLVALMGCDSPTAPAAMQTEQQKVQENVAKLATQDPIPDLSNSLERKNIIKRLRLFEDENKVSYIYLISFGRVMAFYPIKGKVSSGGKRLTNDQQLVQGYTPGGQYGYSNPKSDVINAPELDGTYGKSGDYIFFWTTSNVYVQWNGEFMLADQPLKLSTQPELIYDITPNK